MYNTPTDLVAWFRSNTMEDRVNIYLRKRSRSSSGTLLVTFVFGFAIGFFVAYAFFGGSPKPFPVPAAPPVAALPAEQPAAEAVPMPESPQEAPPEPIAEAPAPAADIWPGRFIMISAPKTMDDDTAAFLAEVRPGAVLLRETHLRDPKRTLETIISIKKAAGFGQVLSDLPLIAVEQEGGKINPLGLESAPSAAELAKTRDTEAARLLGQATAEAALPRGIGIVLAPVLAVLPKGVKNDAMEGRMFGSDQEMVANMGLALADGISLGGAISVAKYYPGVGIAKNQGTGMQVLDAESPKLAELMYPFWEAATAGLPGILAGHVAVPSLDLLEPDRPASMSPVLIRRILRNDWKYSGVILADDVCSPELAATAAPGKAAVDALAAGCDAVLALDTDFDAVRAVCSTIQEALDNGALSEEALVESRGRLEWWQTQLAGYGVPQDQPSVELASERDIPAEPAPKPEVVSQQAPAAPMPAEPAPEEPDVPAPAEPAPVQPAPAEPAPAEPPASADTETTAETPSVAAGSDELVEIVHVIQPGEMLSGIAASYGVKQSDIVKWNKLKTTQIKYGFKLKIYRPASVPPLPPGPVTAPEPAPGPAPETAAEQPPPESEQPAATEQPPPAPEPEQPAPAKQPSPAPEPEQPAATEKAGPVEPEAAAAEMAQPDQTTVLVPNRRKYVVQAGDTLNSICQSLGIDAKLIMAWNGLENEDVSEGQVLIIFASGAATAPGAVDQEGFYTVCDGDNAYRIAEKFNTDVKTLLEMNKGVKNADLLIVGQRIAVPKRP
ncbi:MAG TPA: glycoside hydrolase family 3 N-terminal domain-containing protein [Candidatus Bathyarchaeia archaeon]|nr:glycoside hydrolase family 3 N-terminal domain-containing protein [Candidatus Bathyarchaeia archaeon]